MVDRVFPLLSFLPQQYEGSAGGQELARTARLFEISTGAGVLAVIDVDGAEASLEWSRGLSLNVERLKSDESVRLFYCP